MPKYSRNVSADRFVGRCPECDSTICMVRQKKEPRHPVTEWEGVCANEHHVSLRSSSDEVKGGDECSE